MGRLKGIILATTLGASSVSSHAGDVFENPEIPASEVCRTTALILDGKDLCEKSEKRGAKKPEVSGMSVGLALLLGGAGLVGGRMLRRQARDTLAERRSNRTEPKVGEELPVLTDIVIETQDAKDLIRKAVVSVEGVTILQDFIDSGYTDVITFSLAPEEGSAMETDYVFKILIEKETGKISFQRHVPTFTAMKKDGKWENTAMPQYVTVENIKNYFETLPILPLYGRKPGE